MGEDPDYPGGPGVITRVIVRGGLESEGQSRGQDRSRGRGMLCRQRKGPQARDTGGFQELEQTREHISPGTSEGTLACQHLDFSQ